MKKLPVAVGEMFYKAGKPRVVWTVERFSLSIRLAHVVLARLDDPTTKITVSAGTLSNPRFFCRSIASSQISN